VSLDLRCFSKSRTETTVLYADVVYLNIEGEGGHWGGCPCPTVKDKPWCRAAGLVGYHSGAVACLLQLLQ